MPRNNYPIGVFDSGLGGLTVVKELMRILPNEDIVYYGDTARVPYGTKSKESIVRFSIENARVLLKYKVKMIVVACNSSASHALKVLQKKFSVPIVGVIDPGVRKAVSTTKTKRIGVIATQATMQAQAYPRAIGQTNGATKVFTQSCPLFVPLAEEGWLNKDVTVKVAQKYLAPLKKNRIDTLILGCTHYPLLKGTLRKVMGQRVSLIDSAKETAREVREILLKTKRHQTSNRRARYKFLISDRPQEFERIAKRFLGKNVRTFHQK